MTDYSIDPTVFCGFYNRERLPPEEKIKLFLKLFHAPEDASEYTPLFLVLNHSSSGEVATSFGLFEKDKTLFEVSGTECSVWDFNGCWEPEETTIEALTHRLTVGRLGEEDSEESSFNKDLLAVLDRISLLESIEPYKKDAPTPLKKKI